jgi:hypothetical protein
VNPYTMFPAAAGFTFPCIIQKGPDGRPLFQHNTNAKRQAVETDPKKGNNLHVFNRQSAMRAALERLKREWSFMIYPWEQMTSREREFAAGLVGVWTYERVGIGRREMELLDGGEVGRGRASCEKRWCVVERGGDFRLVIVGEGHKGTDIAMMTLSRDAEGSWRGDWAYHEKGPTVWRQLSGPPSPPPPAAAVTGTIVIPVLIIPTLNRPELLARHVTTIDVRVRHVVVIDNGRYWPRGARLPSLDCRAADRLTVVELPGNLGVAGSWNLGVKATPYAPWWMIANDDIAWPAGSLELLAKTAGRDRVTAFKDRWFAAFTLGEEVVEKAGLFDERFHPAYYEDDDYLRRVAAVGLEFVEVAVPVHHDGSASREAAPPGRADETTDSNQAWHRAKAEANDLSEGWSLTRRRELGWDRP